MPSFLRRPRRMSLWDFSSRYWSRRKCNRLGVLCRSRNKSSILSGEKTAAFWLCHMTNLTNLSTQVLLSRRVITLPANRHRILLSPHRGRPMTALLSNHRATTLSRRAAPSTTCPRTLTTQMFTTSRVEFWATWKVNMRWIKTIWPSCKWTR